MEQKQKRCIKNIDNGKNLTTIDKMTVALILILVLMIMLKQVISTYISSLITLIPSFIVIFWFIISFIRKKIEIRKYDIVFIIMIAIGTLSGLIYRQNIIAILYQIKSISIYYLFFMVVRSINFKSNQVKLLLNSLNLITLILIAFSIIEVIFQKDYLFPLQWSEQIVYADNYIRAYSLICNPNVYAFYLIFIILINYNYKSDEFNTNNIIMYSLCIVGIFLAISRSAILCLIAIIIVYFIKLSKQRIGKVKIKKLLTVFFIIFTTVLISVISIYKMNSLYKQYLEENGLVSNIERHKLTRENFNDRMSAMLDYRFLNNSLKNGRIAIVKYGLSKWKNHKLIGSGFSSFLTASNFLNPDKEAEKLGLVYADNQYIAILVEGGLLSLICMIIWFIMVLKEQLNNKKQVSVTATFTFAFFGMFINVLEVQLIACLYFLFIGLNETKMEDL